MLRRRKDEHTMSMFDEIQTEIVFPPGEAPHPMAVAVGGPVPTRAPARKHSLWGIASFLWALLVGGGGFMLAVMSGMVGMVDPTLEATSPIYGALGLAMCATFPAGLLGLALSVVGLMEPGRHKVFAVLGFAFNLLVIVSVVALMIIGTLMSIEPGWNTSPALLKMLHLIAVV
jgi:hypothetical protein